MAPSSINRIFSVTSCFAAAVATNTFLPQVYVTPDILNPHLPENRFQMKRHIGQSFSLSRVLRVLFSFSAASRDISTDAPASVDFAIDFHQPDIIEGNGSATLFICQPDRRMFTQYCALCSQARRYNSPSETMQTPCRQRSGCNCQTMIGIQCAQRCQVFL